jgi:hypothetical protein
MFLGKKLAVEGKRVLCAVAKTGELNRVKIALQGRVISRTIPDCRLLQNALWHHGLTAFCFTEYHTMLLQPFIFSLATPLSIANPEFRSGHLKATDEN